MLFGLRLNWLERLLVSKLEFRWSNSRNFVRLVSAHFSLGIGLTTVSDTLELGHHYEGDLGGFIELLGAYAGLRTFVVLKLH